MIWKPSIKIGLSWSSPYTRQVRVEICISALFLLPYGKVQHRGLAPGDSVPYVLHFLHTLGADNSISRFTDSLIFLLFVSLSLPPPVVYTFYLICAFKKIFLNTENNLKHTTKMHRKGKWKDSLNDLQPSSALWRICSRKHEIFTDVWVVQG